MKQYSVVTIGLRAFAKQPNETKLNTFQTSTASVKVAMKFRIGL